MKMNTAIQPKSLDEVPNFIIRLRNQKGQEKFMFVDEESPLLVTIIPGQATRYTKSDAHKTLGIREGVSIQAYELLRGAKILPVEQMLDPEEKKMIIRFHVASGKTFEEGKEILEIVRVILQKEYPNTEILGDHWEAGCGNFCHVANYKPLAYPQAHAIEIRVIDIIKRVSERVKHRELEEVYDYA